LYFAYEPGKPILKDICFTCQPGELIGILGESGSGKSTLVNLLPRFYDVADDMLWLDGRPIRVYAKSYLRQQIGLVEQQPFLFSATIRENLTYGVRSEVSRHELELAARAAALHETILSFPEGFETLVGEMGITLSGGQKQRLVIARTLLKDPAILILDDATAAVDAETENAIRVALKLLLQGRTAFIISHRIRSLMYAQQILVLKNGTVCQRGTHRQLCKQPGFYKEVFELQTRIEEELDKEATYETG
jgi:ATP-binding cassette subfamily B protein